jgi:dTDP-L-rhamnose 4-epimerase
MAKYVHVNSFGTAQMLEIIRDENLPVKKVVVAYSQAVYREGAANCPRHGRVFPESRQTDQLSRGDYAVRCPVCGEPSESVPTPEEAPMGGETVYAITKSDQERLTLAWGRQTGIPTVALRYSCTYGPRQSVFNPYTGVIAIFATRLLNGQPPVLYEDGEQTRDLCFVGDVARANLLVAESDALDGLPVNVGSGQATTIREVAASVAEALDARIEPLVRGEFRPGEMRHLTSDISRLRTVGYKPQVDLSDGIGRYLAWIQAQGDIHDYFAEAEELLREKRIVHSATVTNPKS